MHIILRFGGNFHAIVHQTFHIVNNIVEIIRQSRIAFSVLHSLQVRLSEALLRVRSCAFDLLICSMEIGVSYATASMASIKNC